MKRRNPGGRPSTGRTAALKVKCTPAEKRELVRRAKLCGVDVGELVRRRVLMPFDGRQAVLWLDGKDDSAVAAERSRAARAAVRAAERRSTSEEVEKEEVAAEVGEAKLVDDAAREEFLERRACELFGQGKTTPVARALAEAEWRAR